MEIIFLFIIRPTNHEDPQKTKFGVHNMNTNPHTYEYAFETPLIIIFISNHKNISKKP